MAPGHDSEEKGLPDQLECQEIFESGDWVSGVSLDRDSGKV